MTEQDFGSTLEVNTVLSHGYATRFSEDAFDFSLKMWEEAQQHLDPQVVNALGASSLLVQFAVCDVLDTYGLDGVRVGLARIDSSRPLALDNLRVEMTKQAE